MSIYILKVSDIALSNKYTKWYTNICNNAITRCSNKKEAKELLGYVEKHHILPKCFSLGGDKDKTNIVFLSAREHFLVHWLATRMFNSIFKQKMLWAFRGLKRINKLQQRNYTSIQYEALKKVSSQIYVPRTEEQTIRYHETIANRRKLGIKIKRPKSSKETIDKIKNTRRTNKENGITHKRVSPSDETKQKRLETRRKNKAVNL